MSEIPEDIIKEAYDFQRMVDADPKAYVAFDVAVLAMIKERERCAKISESIYSIEQECMDTANFISQCIREES